MCQFFHTREKRKVDLEFSDVRVHGRFYAVDPNLRGDQVLVSYDPYSTLEEVRLTSLHDVFLGIGKRYEREKGAHGQPSPAPSPTPLDHAYLKMLEATHRAQQQQQAAAGVAYHQAQQRHVWRFPSFAAALAKLLGRQGGVSGLSTQELELLSQVHDRLPRITQRLLEQAFRQAEQLTIPVIVFHLQNLLNERAS